MYQTFTRFTTSTYHSCGQPHFQMSKPRFLFTPAPDNPNVRAGNYPGDSERHPFLAFRAMLMVEPAWRC